MGKSIGKSIRYNMQFKVWTQKGRTWYIVFVWVVKVYDCVLCYIGYTCCYAMSSWEGVH